MLITFEIRNFRGIVRLSAEPKGKSVKLKGDNGVGKSCAIDALYWALGGNLDAEVVRNGADKTETEIEFGDYLVIRKQTKGKKPTLVVKSRDGKTTFNSPASILAGFKDAIDRHTFSHKTGREQAAILRKLAPTLDTTALDAEHKQKYEERTNVNREAKMLIAQAEGITVEDAPELVNDDKDIAAIAAKKTEAEKVRAANSKVRYDYETAERAARRSAERTAECVTAVNNAKEALAIAERDQGAIDDKFIAAKEAVEKLADPDTSAIDAEIEAAKRINAELAKLRQAQDRAKEAKKHRGTLKDRARELESDADTITRRLEQIEKEKAALLAKVKLPVDGLAIDGEMVTLTQDAGPVEISALNTATRIKLDVAIAAACGHKICAIHEASLLGTKMLKEIEAFARKNGVQLIEELVVSGEPLVAEIVEEDGANNG